MGSNSCPICLEEIVVQIRASPDTCDHVFCLPCLQKWSKLGSYCPVDRKRYKKILNLDSFATIQVKPRKRKRISRVLYDISTSCEVCSKDNNPDILLLCDCCDLGFHMCCLSPPLKAVPAGSWICPPCVAVEKKLKDKKGISKEVEADVIKSEIVEASKNHISEECDVAITDYEAISVTSWDQNVFCSDILDDTDSNSANKINEIFKTTNYKTQSSKQNLLKHSKTYNLQNKKKSTSKPLFQEHANKIHNVDAEKQGCNVGDMCLKNSISEDVNLLDQCLFEGEVYGYMKPDVLIDEVHDSCDTHIQNYEDYNQVECSVTNPLHSGMVKKNTEINPKENVNYSLNTDDLQEGYPAIDKSLKKVPRNSKTVINENAEDLPYLDTFVSESSPKGTYNLNTEFISENSKQMAKEKIHFSVFDRIDDIDMSQKKYSKINSLINTVDLRKPDCLFCKDMTLKSQKYCKLCKLKYFEKSVKEKGGQGSEHFPGISRFGNIGTVLLDNQKNSIKRPKTSVSERRRRSLLRKLREIRDSKWMLVP